jgi:hypothetical protein
VSISYIRMVAMGFSLRQPELADAFLPNRRGGTGQASALSLQRVGAAHI